MGFFWEGLLLGPIPWGNLELSRPIPSDTTGTYRGDATELMAQYSGQCLAIEHMSSFVPITGDRFSSFSRATFSMGNLLDFLSQAVPQRDTSTLPCLDAHEVCEFNILGAGENPLPAEIHTVISAQNSMVERFSWRI